MEHHQRLAILVSGGPAPGINRVIAAATIRARLEGLDVVGIRDGFEWLMQGDIDHVTPMISIQGGRFVPIPFDTMIDPDTGRTRVRSVDVSSTRYAVARQYMLRLKREDFEDPHDLAKLAATAHLGVEEFRAQFAYLTTYEPSLVVSAGASPQTSFP
jgi:hypothetical protein